MLPSEPHALEVNGLLKREGGHTQFASPMLQRFVRDVWSGLRIGDIYALQGKWKEAWQQYHNNPADMSERPISGSTRLRLRETLTDWQRHMKMHRKVNDVVCHFLYGMRYLLGFDCGGFYAPETRAWMYSQYGILDTTLPPPARSEDVEKINAPMSDGATLTYWIDAQRVGVWCDAHVASLFPGVPDHAFYFKRVGVGREMDATDEDYLTRSLIEFWEAYEAAQEIEYRDQIGKLRERFSLALNKVTETVSSELLEDVLNMENVLEAAVRGLVNTAGYYRVLICFVNADRSRIQAVATHCQGVAVGFNFETDYPLPVRGTHLSAEQAAELDVRRGS